jgi:tRNA(Ile)-lysidine synthase
VSGLIDLPDLDPAGLIGPLLARGRLGLAVSGGPDSLALLVLAHEHAIASGTTGSFVVYTVDHGLRPEAAQEAADVVAIASGLGFAARLLRWEGAKPSTGLAAAARTARYRLIGAAMSEDGCCGLVTAHHLGDQAETVLMRLAHGSGLEGLSGMAPEAEVEGVTVLRPLLAVDPEALAALVAAKGLTPARDPSNLDRDYERVRWRQMLPQLAALGLDARRLALFARRAAEAEAALTAMTAQALGNVTVSADGSTAQLERAMLAELPTAIATRLMQRLIGDIGGGRKRHALGQVEALVERVVQGPARVTLHGCLISAGPRLIRIGREPPRRRKPFIGQKEPAAS